MKSILTASICSVALAMAVPAMAQTHHKMHHGKNHMQGPHTKSKMAGDPTTAQLNEQSLNAARGGTAPAMGTQGGATPAANGAMAPSSGTMAPAGGAMAPAGSGTPASTTPTNAPGGQ